MGGARELVAFLRWTCARMGISSTVVADTPRRSQADLCVVIPARNEEKLVGRCLLSVLAAGVSPEHVFVIDDGSSDRTGDILRGFCGVNIVTR